MEVTFSSASPKIRFIYSALIPSPRSCLVAPFMTGFAKFHILQSKRYQRYYPFLKRLVGIRQPGHFHTEYVGPAFRFGHLPAGAKPALLDIAQFLPHLIAQALEII